MANQYMSNMQHPLWLVMGKQALRFIVMKPQEADRELRNCSTMKS